MGKLRPREAAAPARVALLLSVSLLESCRESIAWGYKDEFWGRPFGLTLHSATY